MEEEEEIMTAYGFIEEPEAELDPNPPSPPLPPQRSFGERDYDITNFSTGERSYIFPKEETLYKELQKEGRFPITEQDIEFSVTENKQDLSYKIKASDSTEKKGKKGWVEATIYKRDPQNLNQTGMSAEEKFGFEQGALFFDDRKYENVDLYLDYFYGEDSPSGSPRVIYNHLLDTMKENNFISDQDNILIWASGGIGDDDQVKNERRLVDFYMKNLGVEPIGIFLDEKGEDVHTTYRDLKDKGYSKNEIKEITNEAWKLFKNSDIGYFKTSDGDEFRVNSVLLLGKNKAGERFKVPVKEKSQPLRSPMSLARRSKRLSSSPYSRQRMTSKKINEDYLWDYSEAPIFESHQVPQYKSMAKRYKELGK